MGFESAKEWRIGSAWGAIATLAAIDGSAEHAVPRALAGRDAAARDLADAVHAWCWLHGHHPGAIDLAVIGGCHPTARDWLRDAAAGFAGERAYLARLAAAAGPLPSTPGQAESEAAVAAQRHAIDMLAQSRRTGCAIGAAIALVLDWQAVRGTLDAAACRFGMTPHPCRLPGEVETALLVAALAETPAIERAIAFGAQQILTQHRGLWTLLQTRASARNRA